MINNKAIKQYLSGLLLGLGSLLIGFAIAGIYTSRSFEKPNIKDITTDVPRAYIVQSGSMEPSIKTGSVVFTYPNSTYAPGDIVTFATGTSQKKENLITHRINFKLYPEGVNANPVYITSGDANETLDPTRIGNENIVGKVFFSVPYLGYVANFAKQPYGFILLVIVPATIVIYEELKTLLGELLKSLKKIKLFKGRSLDRSDDTGKSDIIKVFAIFPILGSFMVFIALTGSFFSDIVISKGNIFSAATDFTDLSTAEFQTLSDTLAVADTNPDCISLGFTYGYKIERADLAEKSYTLTSNNEDLVEGAPEVESDSITISNIIYDIEEGEDEIKLFDWSATIGIDAVIVKGGQGANQYPYTPEAFSDTLLNAPLNEINGKFFGVDHVEFCYSYAGSDI